MHGFDVNWAAVGTAAVVRFAIGGVWFAPPVFGARWGRLVGLTAEAYRAAMPRAMIVDFLCGLVMAWILANSLKFMGAVGLVPGMRTSFFLWLGFVATVLLSTKMYEIRPLSLYAITSGFWLVAMLAMGAIIGVW